MTEELKNKINEQLKTLPKESLDAVHSFDWLAQITAVGNSHGLLEQDIDNLAIETVLVMTGLAYPQDIAMNIEDEVGIPRNQAEIVAQELLAQVFVPIANKIRETIKNNSVAKEWTWRESLDFILSGGDYGVLMKKHVVSKDFTDTIRAIVPPSKIEDIKSKFVI